MFLKFINLNFWENVPGSNDKSDKSRDSEEDSIEFWEETNDEIFEETYFPNSAKSPNSSQMDDFEKEDEPRARKRRRMKECNTSK